MFVFTAYQFNSIITQKIKMSFVKLDLVNNIHIIIIRFIPEGSLVVVIKNSFQYPIIEFLTAILFTYAAFTFQIYQSLLISFIIFILLITVTIDLNKQIIFLAFTYTIFFIGLLIQFFEPELNPFNVSLKNSLITAVIAPSFFLILRYIFKKIKNVEALGLGDVYLIAYLEIWTGFEKFLYLLIGSSI